MNIKEKIGQLIAVGVNGALSSDQEIIDFKKLVQNGSVGGVILYRYNIVSPEQTKALIQDIQSAASSLPLFVMLDQEGGKVQRLNSQKGFEDTQSAKYVADNMNLDEARSHYERLGEILKEAGFNFDFAPCVDLDGDPQCPAIGKIERSYSSDSEKVVQYAESMIEGLGRKGVLSCIKHYPGHGRVSEDSHVGLVDITRTWSEEELEPFKQIISDGAADSVMTAHLMHLGIDPDNPVTFSKKWIDKLRNEMGFDGVIVTDDLHMGAMIKNYSLKKVVINALKAGADLLIFSNNPLAAKATGIRHDETTGVVVSEDGSWIVPDPNLPEKITSIVEEALNSGELDVALIDNAVRRVLKLKGRI